MFPKNIKLLTIVLIAIFCFSQRTVNSESENLYHTDQSKNPLVQAAQKVQDAVVSIGGTETRYYQKPLNRNYRNRFDFFSQFMVYPKEQEVPYRGTGFIIDQEGYVITNYHVIEDLDQLTVTLPDRGTLQAKLLDADKVVDIALLKIEGEDLPSVKLGDSDKLLIGEWSMAVGNPFGDWIDDPRPTVTIGVISALNRSFKPDSNQYRVYQRMIQTDAAINPGNSGGPLVNIKGEVIGVNTFIFSRVGGSHGIGFAIPINRVKQIVEEIKTHGRIRTLWLDVEIVNLTPTFARSLGLQTTQGAYVRYIEPDGSGDQAGLKTGDVIRKIEDRTVRNVDEFAAYFAARQVGDTIDLEVYSEGKIKNIDYKIREYPK